MLKSKLSTFVLNGVTLELDSDVVSEKMLNVIRSGRYEGPEAQQIPTVTQADEVILELGAGIGYISALAGLQGLAKKIVVFEANPQLIPIIRRTHQINGVESEINNAVVLPKKTAETTKFYIRRDFWASSLSPESYGYDEVVDVPIVAFEDVLRRYRPTMLIIDIEGGEIDLLHDIPLTGVSKVLIELHQTVIGRVGMKQVFDFFSARDFHYDQWHSSHAVVLFSHVLR